MLTYDEAIKIQVQQLEQWKSILKPKVYKDLLKAIKTANKLIAKKYGKNLTGYDLPRGTSIDNFIANYKLGHDNPIWTLTN